VFISVRGCSDNNAGGCRQLYGKYSEIVWLPTGRTATTSTNADALTGLPNTYRSPRGAGSGRPVASRSFRQKPLIPPKGAA